MNEPANLMATQNAIKSNLEVPRLTPFYESGAKDPWAGFYAAGQKNLEAQASHIRMNKRARDDEVDAVLNQPLNSRNAASELAGQGVQYDIDPNIEFTDPPWLLSQESLS